MFLHHHGGGHVESLVKNWVLWCPKGTWLRPKVFLRPSPETSQNKFRELHFDVFCSPLWNLARLRQNTPQELHFEEFCVPPIVRSVFMKHVRHHRVRNFTVTEYGMIYGWVLSDVERFEKPFEYEHLQGAVIWVKV